MKITVEIDEIRSERGEASLYEARYKIVRGWFVNGLPNGESQVWKCGNTAEFDTTIDDMLKAGYR